MNVLVLTLALGLSLAEAQEAPPEPPPPLQAEELPQQTSTGTALPSARGGFRFDPDGAIDLTWDEEVRFVRSNRLAGVGAGIAAGGVAVGFGGGVLLLAGAFGGSPGLVIGGATAFTIGAVGTVAGPILGIAGTLRAASVLRQRGVRVPRGWAWASIVCLAGSVFAYPALVTYPAAVLLPLAQSGANRSAFARSLGRVPRSPNLVVGLAPVAIDNGRGLALVGTW